jgi:uncharacterized protein (DUF1499 family)
MLTGRIGNTREVLFMKLYCGHYLVISASLFLICCAGGANPETRPSAVLDPSGRLQPCPSSPNCVSSLAQDPEHHMAPLPYRVDRTTSRRLLLSVVGAMPRTTLVTDEDHYLHYEFRSRVFGFVDDVEFLFDDEAALIQFRSASRTGYSDFGVNRSRMTAIGEAYQSAPLDVADKRP